MQSTRVNASTPFILATDSQKAYPDDPNVELWPAGSQESYK